MSAYTLLWRAGSVLAIHKARRSIGPPRRRRVHGRLQRDLYRDAGRLRAPGGRCAAVQYARAASMFEEADDGQRQARTQLMLAVVQEMSARRDGGPLLKAAGE